MNWYLTVLKNYAEFNGRARRTEYWVFILFNTIFAFAATILDSFLFGSSFGGFGPVYIIYGLAVIIPSWAVYVRRLHDVGKSGWYILIILIPIIGIIWMLVLLSTGSQPGNNQYGENPHTK